jgi:hypothetical protein
MCTYRWNVVALRAGGNLLLHDDLGRRWRPGDEWLLRRHVDHFAHLVDGAKRYLGHRVHLRLEAGLKTLRHQRPPWGLLVHRPWVIPHWRRLGSVHATRGCDLALLVQGATRGCDLALLVERATRSLVTRWQNPSGLSRPIEQLHPNTIKASNISKTCPTPNPRLLLHQATAFAMTNKNMHRNSFSTYPDQKSESQMLLVRVSISR